MPLRVKVAVFGYKNDVFNFFNKVDSPTGLSIFSQDCSLIGFISGLEDSSESKFRFCLVNHSNMEQIEKHPELRSLYSQRSIYDLIVVGHDFLSNLDDVNDLVEHVKSFVNKHDLYIPYVVLPNDQHKLVSYLVKSDPNLQEVVDSEDCGVFKFLTDNGFKVYFLPSLIPPSDPGDEW